MNYWVDFDIIQTKRAITTCRSCSHSVQELDPRAASRLAIEVATSPINFLVLIGNEEDYEGIIDTAKREGMQVLVACYKDGLRKEKLYKRYVEIGELLNAGSEVPVLEEEQKSKCSVSAVAECTTIQLRKQPGSVTVFTYLDVLKSHVIPRCISVIDDQYNEGLKYVRIYFLDKEEAQIAIYLVLLFLMPSLMKICNLLRSRKQSCD
eukprot:TRINITY_DN12815_c0_g2_i1.p1 TRINITY_DN12815_c0_g2~~TRINITY_DN12815_c0_g2_i1.p1  ORF type:complete len:207 (-),score=18.95 TRINITY_DN12815_c0_g2_i1:466-1086(-)